MPTCKECGKDILPRSMHTWNVEYKRKGVVIPYKETLFSKKEIAQVRKEVGVYDLRVTSEGHLGM